MTPALMTGNSTAVDTAADICPRCNQHVFIAEKRQAAGKVTIQSTLYLKLHKYYIYKQNCIQPTLCL